MIRLLRVAELSADGVVATLARPHAAIDPDYTPAGLRAAWPHLVALADAEGLHGHAEAARIRLDETRTRGDH
jgi:histidinol dehydrogenase